MYFDTDDPRRHITGTMRAFFLPFVVDALKEIGVWERLQLGPVAVDECGLVQHRLQHVFWYLRDIGWLEDLGDHWQLTDVVKSSASDLARADGEVAELLKNQELLRWLQELAKDEVITVDEKGLHVHKEHSLLSALQHYGWVDEDSWPTKLGESVLKRVHDLLTYSAYESILSVLPKLLREPDFEEFRLWGQDVNGSGGAGDRLYFSRPMDKLRAAIDAGLIDTVVDVGAGNGKYLRLLKAEFPEVRLIGVEYFKDALGTLMAMNERHDCDDIQFIEGSLTEPSKLAQFLEECSIDLSKTAVTTWHIVQEVLKFPEVSLSGLLEDWSSHFGMFVVGDMYAQRAHLVRQTAPTIMVPEILLANRLSGQVLLLPERINSEVKTAENAGVFTVMHDSFGVMEKGLSEYPRFYVLVVTRSSQVRDAMSS